MPLSIGAYQFCGLDIGAVQRKSNLYKCFYGYDNRGMAVNQNKISNFRVQTLAEIKAIANANLRTICHCDQTGRTYVYIDDGSAFTADDDIVLTTGKGGDTRWICSQKALVLDGTTYGDRLITSATGGVLNIALGSAAGDDLAVDTDKLVVKGDTGNIGIGTANPQQKLHIISSSDGGEAKPLLLQNPYGTANTKISIEFVTYPNYEATGKISVTSIDGAGNYSMEMGPYGNLSLLTMMTNGNVGIGEVAPDSKLEVNGSIHATNLDGGATNITVNASGQIVRDLSDEQLKKNVRPIVGALEKVLLLEGVAYDWKPEAGMGEGSEYGIIAQAAELVDPVLVVTSTISKDTWEMKQVTKNVEKEVPVYEVSPAIDGMDAVTTTKISELKLKDGQLPKIVGTTIEEFVETVDEKVYRNPIVDNLKGINHRSVFALLVEAIKEQNATISSQQQMINSLIERVSALEKTI